MLGEAREEAEERGGDPGRRGTGPAGAGGGAGDGAASGAGGVQQAAGELRRRGRKKEAGRGSRAQGGPATGSCGPAAMWARGATWRRPVGCGRRWRNIRPAADVSGGAEERVRVLDCECISVGMHIYS